MLAFSHRNAKEILRDPLAVSFSLGFPLVLLLLLSAIQANIPVPLFEIQHLAPGVTVFGLAFLTLFSATLISKDRSSSFMQRLYTTPLTSLDIILGYTLPILPLSLVQCCICYIGAMALGLKFTINLIFAIVGLVPISLLYIAMGLLCGSVLTDKQVGGICGALLTNVSAWLSGIWFDLDLVGGTFRKVAYFLPFVHAVDMERALLAGNFSDVTPHFIWVLGYAVALFVLAVLLFLRQMKRQ